jgi:ribose transport system ATP-binding protein
MAEHHSGIAARDANNTRPGGDNVLHLVTQPAVPLFEARKIRKSYGGVHALTDASLACFAGEVHGLVGQNGAGKSTVIKILSGAVTPDSGELMQEGRPIRLSSPLAARSHGIGTVFQELSVVADLSVAINLLYGTPEIANWGRLDQRRLMADAKEKLANLGLDRLDPHALVRDLSLSDRQVLEVAKVVLRKPRLLVLDEATSALLPKDVEWLQQIATAFAREGGAVVFVSHRMQEVMSFSHRLTVFREGRDVGTGLVTEFGHDDLIELMLGRRIDSNFPPRPQRIARTTPLMEVSGVKSGRRLTGVDLKLYPGEILGVGGLQGQGQRDLFLALYGAQALSGGVTINGQPADLRSPTHAIDSGIALIPEDRGTEGLFQTLAIKDNILVGNLGSVSRAGLLFGSAPGRLVESMIAALQVKLRSPYQEVGGLSGGNQQKVLLARALAQEPKILLMYDPTRGVDVGTKSEIYRLMREQCAKGVGVLFYSSDAAELAAVSDRVVVLHDGRIGAELEGAALTEESVVRAVVGSSDPTETASSQPASAHPAETSPTGFRLERALRVLPLFMPYVYALAFIVTILALQPALISGRDMIDGRATLIVPLALIAYGQTFVVITRGIDLSVGGLVSLCSALLCTYLNADGPILILEVLAILGVGGVLGAINGVLVAHMRLEPFLITLSTWTIAGGLAFAVLPIEGGSPAPSLIVGLTGNLFGVPKSVLAIALLFAAWAWLRRSIFIVDLTAIGSDERRARLAGVRVAARKIQAYVATGVLASAAAIWLTAQTATGSPRIGDEFILASIVAVVLGGTSIFGGLGSAASSVAGAIAFMLIPTLVYALNLASFWSICLQGFVLMLAVIANALVQSAGARRRK